LLADAERDARDAEWNGDTVAAEAIRRKADDYRRDLQAGCIYLVPF
jgi:hypothetical protein